MARKVVVRPSCSCRRRLVSSSLSCSSSCRPADSPSSRPWSVGFFVLSSPIPAGRPLLLPGRPPAAHPPRPPAPAPSRRRGRRSPPPLGTSSSRRRGPRRREGDLSASRLLSSSSSAALGRVRGRGLLRSSTISPPCPPSRVSTEPAASEGASRENSNCISCQGVSSHAITWKRDRN